MKTILLIPILMTSIAFAEGKYKPVVIGDKNVETTAAKTPSAIESAIQDHVVAELGDQPRYKSGGKRVLSINLIEQVAGPNKGKILADVSYIADPNIVGVINKDGLIIDAMRLLKVISQDKRIKVKKIVTVLLRPYVVTIDNKTSEQVAKFQIDLSAFAGIKWDQIDGAKFETILSSKGNITMAPYMVQNGGKFLILKREQLDL